MKAKELEEYWTINLSELDEATMRLVDARFKAGIKEVVDWIEKHKVSIGFTGFKTNETHTFSHIVMLDNPLWEGKLKEWGVNPQ